jgi:5-methylcytosine-specific restriction endonuclease McrA
MKIEKSEKSGKSHSGNQPSTKRLILKIRGHQCEICSRKDWDGGKIPLVLDHIDGNSDNWKMDNLRLVCGNCNMLLPTFTSKNKNSKRTNRKKYYKCQK